MAHDASRPGFAATLGWSWARASRRSRRSASKSYAQHPLANNGQALLAEALRRRERVIYIATTSASVLRLLSALVVEQNEQRGVSRRHDDITTSWSRNAPQSAGSIMSAESAVGNTGQTAQTEGNLRPHFRQFASVPGPLLFRFFRQGRRRDLTSVDLWIIPGVRWQSRWRACARE
jgi:hypothetical protein